MKKIITTEDIINKKFKKIAIICIVVGIAFFAFESLCCYVEMNSNSCDLCGKEWLGNAYYGMDYDDTLCENCAQRYWAPYSYENFKK